jgi:hypothetical protein
MVKVRRRTDAPGDNDACGMGKAHLRQMLMGTPKFKGASRTKADEGEYGEYLSEEQRSSTAGGGGMQRSPNAAGLSPRAVGPCQLAPRTADASIVLTLKAAETEPSPCG